VLPFFTGSQRGEGEIYDECGPLALTHALRAYGATVQLDQVLND
jgi:hypothetical protein